MPTRDLHRFSNQLDSNTSARLIDRLERRARDEVFSKLFDQYIEKINFPKNGNTLEIGCGTGAMTRSLVRNEKFEGNAFGIDQSEAFISAARELAAVETKSEIITFNVGDAHHLNFDDEYFDVVIAHTLLSHVTNANEVLKEIARVIKKGGTFVVFDGNYSSLTFKNSNPEFGRAMEKALALATFNNPQIMQALLKDLPASGFEIKSSLENVISESKTASYFKSFVETYAPLVLNGNYLPKTEVEKWIAEQNEAMGSGTFSASCEYITYICKRN